MRVTMEQIDVVYKMVQLYPDVFRIALTSNDTGTMSPSFNRLSECLQSEEDSVVNGYGRRTQYRQLTGCTTNVL